MNIRETKEIHLEYLRKYYQDHKKEAIERARKWREKQLLINPEKMKEMNVRSLKKWRLTPKYRFKVIKSNSKKKGLFFNLSQDDFIQWFNNTPKNCFYCDISEEISKYKTGKILQIDRMDNNIGYQIDNMVLACYLCNKIKSNLLTQEETKFIGENIIKKKWLI